jgi:hypothetical protein
MMMMMMMKKTRTLHCLGMSASYHPLTQCVTSKLELLMMLGSMHLLQYNYYRVCFEGRFLMNYITALVFVYLV